MALLAGDKLEMYLATGKRKHPRVFWIEMQGRCVCWGKNRCEHTQKGRIIITGNRLPPSFPPSLPCSRSYAGERLRGISSALGLTFLSGCAQRCQEVQAGGAEEH
jgi:hypothetical protein